MSPRRILLVTLVGVVCLVAALLAHRSAEPPIARGPNIVLISTDDMRTGDLAYMPFTRRLLAGNGVSFDNMVSPYPLCCPARAEILSAQYSHNNGVRGNAWPNGGYYKLDSNHTLPVWLKAKGYDTGFIGKYLNQYGKRDPYAVPPGWNHWFASVDGTYDYWYSRYNSDGQLQSYPDVYQTNQMTATAEDWITQFAIDARPYFLWLSYTAPHTSCSVTAASARIEGRCWNDPVGAPGDVGKYSSLPMVKNPSINEKDVSDKSQFIQQLPRYSAWRLLAHERLYRTRLESLQSVDRDIRDIVERLKATGQYDNTYLLFTSDNGFQLGEHRWTGKILGYEPSLRVPMIITNPNLPHGVHRQQTVTTVDIAATIVDLADAGGQVDHPMDGTSMMPLATGRRPDGADRIVPIEAGPLRPNVPGWLYRGVRTSQYTYLNYGSLGEEFYDRRRDPYELNSSLRDPRYSRLVAQLRAISVELQTCKGAQCVSFVTP